MTSDYYKGCGYLTMAFAPRYYDMAIALARSLALHDPGIPRAVATNDPSFPGFRGVFDVVIPQIKDIGPGGIFRHKMSIDLYAPFDRTIYLDSDCLCIHSLAFAFDRFKGMPFGVVGENKTIGLHHWWGARADLGELCRREGAASIPVFNEGLFYLEKGPLASKISDRARDIMDHYRDYPFETRGGQCLDGPCVALAMARHGIPALVNDFTMMKVPIGLQGPLVLDIMNGTSRLDLNGQIINPAVIHLPNIWTKEPVYRRECLKLALWYKTRCSPRLASRVVDGLTNPYYMAYALAMRGAKRLFKRGREHPRPPW